MARHSQVVGGVLIGPRPQVTGGYPVVALPAPAASPGRRQVHDEPPAIPDKPGPDDTPFRSRFYVSRRHSADGNAYARGDPIPEGEEVRQAGRVALGAPRVRIPRATCPRCRGSRLMTDPRPKGHAPDCGCRFCGPCPTCNGSGYVVV